MKTRILTLILLLALLLSACSAEESTSVYTVECNGMSFTVDKANGTITHGEDTYQLSFSTGGVSVTTTITYPNGTTYSWTDTGNSGHGGWGEGYDPERYVAGDILLDAWEQARPATRQRQGNPLLGIVCLLIGAVNLIFPQLAWYLKHGWVYKDAEPSGLALGLARAGGVVAVIAGIVLIVI